MATTGKEQFIGWADPQLLDSIRKIADREGRRFEDVVENALRHFLMSGSTETPRDQVREHFHNSVERNHRLGELLAQ